MSSKSLYPWILDSNLKGLYVLKRGKTPPPKKNDILSITLRYNDGEALLSESMEYIFIVFTSRSTLTRNGSTCLSSI